VKSNVNWIGSSDNFGIDTFFGNFRWNFKVEKFSGPYRSISGT